MDSENFMKDDFHFKSPQQERIYKKLQLIGAGPASFYRDACILMVNGNFDSTTHLVSHLLREIESSLRDVLEPVMSSPKRLSKKEKGGNNNHELEIRAALKYLEIPEEDPVAKAWLKLSGKYGLYSRAHREALKKPRPLDEEFISFWDDMERVLDYVLKQFESRYVEYFNILDNLLAKPQPTRDDIKILMGKVPNNLIVLDYFFGKLHYSSWLEPLRNKDFFKHPPEPERDDEKGTIRYPLWPQSRYLARMAKENPEKVIEIILEIPDIGNFHVHTDIIDAALAMPPELSAKITPRVKIWLKTTNLSHLYDKISNLILHLARGGQIESALELTHNVLEVFLESPTHDKEEYPQKRREVKTHFDAWHYEQIIKEIVPALVETADEKALTLFCNLLEDAIRASGTFEDKEPKDGSYGWRPAIEDSDQNYSTDPMDLLVWAVRESSEILIKTKKKSILEQVEGRPFRIFHRIGLHLRRKFPDIDKAGTERLISDQSVFEDRHLDHEYFHLLKERFPNLKSETQKAYLKLVEQLADAREQYRRLWAIQGYLISEWKQRFDELKDKFGDLDHPDFLSYVTGGMMGPISPKSAEELSAMEVPELISFLKDWQQPSDEPFGPTPEGIGRVLTGIVTSNPVKFATQAEQFIGTDPTYVRALLSGFENAVKKKTSFTWEAVLNLCQWVIEQPLVILGHKGGNFDYDPDWGWTRKQIAYLLSAGLAVKDGIPISLRERVWYILEPLTDDPSPTREEETSTKMSPSSLSINSTRGMALQAVIDYSLWIRRSIKEESDGIERLEKGFEEIPEARDVLDKHLDLKVDPSLAVHSGYGKLFPWLVRLDRNWAIQKIKKIFPMDEPHEEFHKAAWTAYVGYCQPYDEVYDLLKNEYINAVGNIPEIPRETQGEINPDNRLAEHIMTLYWRGKLDLEKSGLVAQFLDKAPKELRFHALTYVGQSLNRTEGPVEPQILKRLKSLWERRHEIIKKAATSGVDIGEQKAFGWWFASGKFDGDWAIKHLKISLETSGTVEMDNLVVERLVSLYPKAPLITVECLNLLVEGDKEGWRVHFWRENAKTILSSALKSTDVGVRKSAEELVSRLVARGYLDFRDLTS